MIDAAYITLSAAAEALGVSESELAVCIRTGNVPEAVSVVEQWFIPHDALSTIATREEMVLDLTGSKPQVELQHSDQALTDDAALGEAGDVETHAAIVVAKAQSAAARSDANTFRRELNLLRAKAERWRHERKELLSNIAGLQQYLEELQEEHSEATRELSEAKTELDHERVERAELTSLCQALEDERNELTDCLGWTGRRRYEHRKPDSPSLQPTAESG